MLSTKIADIDMVQRRPGEQSTTDNLAETVYCNHSHPAIQKLSAQFTQSSTDPADLVAKVFLFVRDKIVFGGDHWQVKASETLAKGYGACFNKNLLMISILRAAKIPSKLMANPLRKTFSKPSIGSAYFASFPIRFTTALPGS